MLTEESGKEGGGLFQEGSESKRRNLLTLMVLPPQNAA
jgi:hypothetical protein